MIGQTISHYKILEKLGGGGMGIVYKAQDLKLDRIVALKFLPPQLSVDKEEKTRFIHEAKAASALDHPNICNIHEIDETEDGQMFICMAYYEGETLKKKIVGKPLSVEQAIDSAIQIAEGLVKAHGQGIVHRDIKPANLMITNDGVLKIVDFGLAKLAGRTKVTKTGTTVGTAAYMSPEQARGETVDARTDIWSLGVVLYEMLSGKLPFEGDYEQALVYSILNEKPEPVTGLRTGVPMELERIVDKAMAKSAGERYQHVDELVVDLKRLKKELETPEILKHTGVQPAVRKKSFRWLVPAVVGVGVAVVVVGLFFTYFLPGEPELASERKMLVVLPFENLGSPEDEYFADGMTEEIMARLAGIHALGVISRTSAIQYKDTEKTPKEIGKELGVEYVLEGTIRWQRSADGPSRVRVTPQLIRVSDDTHLWASIYDEGLTEVFQVQSAIAEQVVKALDIALLEPERRSLEAKPTNNLEAYDYYLRAKKTSYDKEGFLLRVQLLEKALELDPNFALAYAELSETQSTIYFNGYDRTPLRLASSKVAVNRALELDPNLAQAHRALGIYYYRGYLDYDRAMAEYAVAQQLDPSGHLVTDYIAWVQRRQGKFEEAAENIKKAFEFNPRWWGFAEELGITYDILGRYEESDRYADLAIELNPSILGNYWLKSWRHVSRYADVSSARSVLENATKVVGRGTFDWELVYYDIYEGKYQDALTRLSSIQDKVWELQTEFYTKTMYAGWIYSLLGATTKAQEQFEEARAYLEEKVKDRPEDPRFRSALGKVYAWLNQKQDAIREGKAAVSIEPVTRDALAGPEYLYQLAVIYAIAGEHEAAINELEGLATIPTLPRVGQLKVDPIWKPLHGHRRFQRLLEQG